MKVKDLIKKYNMCSNADIFLQTPNGEISKLERDEVQNIQPELLMNSTVNSFDIIDNVLTIHIRY